MRHLHRLAAVLFTLALAACASAPPGEGAGGDCGAKKSAAVERVSKVLEQNSACATSADCVTIPFGNSCFDACTRSVSVAGKAAVEEALHRAENNACEGCTLVPPPCAPPSAPTCVAGHCQ